MRVNLPPIVVLVTGDPIAETLATRGGFLELIRAAAPAFADAPWVAHDVRVLHVLPDLTDALGVIITGSPLSVTARLPWMERTAARLAELVRAEVPVLGICFGHQLLGHALGGRVTPNPRGREMGSVAFTSWVADPVVGEPGTWPVNTTHLDSVVELPPGARVLGSTALEPHAAVRFGPRAWGVQHHPEIDAPVLRQYIAARRPALLAEGLDAAAIERDVQEAPRAAAVIERFLWLASEERERVNSARPGAASGSAV
jgi:GMP synthase (glutamine-hydrolysing)